MNVIDADVAEPKRAHIGNVPQHLFHGFLRKGAATPIQDSAFGQLVGSSQTTIAIQAKPEHCPDSLGFDFIDFEPAFLISFFVLYSNQPISKWGSGTVAESSPGIFFHAPDDIAGELLRVKLIRRFQDSLKEFPLRPIGDGLTCEQDLDPLFAQLPFMKNGIRPVAGKPGSIPADYGGNIECLHLGKTKIDHLQERGAVRGPGTLAGILKDL